MDDRMTGLTIPASSIQARSQRSIDSIIDAEYVVLIDIALGLTDNEGSPRVVGNNGLTRNITAWMPNSLFADLPAASEI